MKGKPIIITALALILISSLSLPANAGSMSQTGVSIRIDGPREIFVNHTEHFTVEIGGVFSDEAVNWSIDVEDVPRGLSVEPMFADSTTRSRFQINVTATRRGNYKFSVAGFCSDGVETRFRRTSIELVARTPVITKVQIRAPLDYGFENVDVGLFVGDELIRTRTIDALEANKTMDIEMMWSKDELSRGEHTLEIWVDYGYGDPGVFNKGEMLLSTSIYVEGEPGPWRIVILVILVIASVLFFMYYMRKRKRKRRPW